MSSSRRNLIIMTVAVTMATGVTGCSIFKPSREPDGSVKGLQGWVESDKMTADKDTQKGNKPNKDVGSGYLKGSGKKAGTKSEKEHDQIADVSNPSNISGDWAIETVFGKQATGETAPFIKFVAEEGRIYGNNGCNVINGDYRIDTEQRTISFGNLATTMMLCAESNITDAEIGEALGNTKKYSIDSAMPDQRLIFYDETGKAIMTLMHRDFHFLDGTWAVKWIEGEAVNNPEMRIALDVEEKRMHGNTGCNIINGELETDMGTANCISFSKIAMTKMACPDSGWETRMTMALEEAVTAEQLSDKEIALIGSNGQQVMLLKRTSEIDD